MKLNSITTLIFSTLLLVGCTENPSKPEDKTQFDLMLDGKTVIANKSSVETKTINEFTGVVECNILVRNNTTSEISMTVTKELIDKGGVANAADINLFCWGLCVGADVAKATAKVPAGPVVCKDPYFTGDLNVDGLASGTKIKVRYVFTDDATKFSRTVDVVYAYIK